MSVTTGSSAAKIEPGQIINPGSFPMPNELVCIQIPKVFDQVSLRDCTTRDIILTPAPGICRPVFTFKGADDFDVTEVKVISKADSLTKPGFKKLKLFVKIRYVISYSDGVNCLTQPDEATFNLVINEIYCPGCTAQTGITQYPRDNHRSRDSIIDEDGLLIKVEALAQVFNEAISTCTGAMLLDIGVFFVVKCECNVQLLIPAYGYCPVPAEQINPSEQMAQNCKSFIDRTRTAFPSQFYPDQKPNTLDNSTI